jgi:hypothetical protein
VPHLFHQQTKDLLVGSNKMKHAVSIKDIRDLIAELDLNITAQRSGSGEISVYSHYAADVPALAVACRMRNIYFDLRTNTAGKYVGSIYTRYKMDQVSA